jgi:hypothetical protein
MHMLLPAAEINAARRVAADMNSIHNYMIIMNLPTGHSGP